MYQGIQLVPVDLEFLDPEIINDLRDVGRAALIIDAKSVRVQILRTEIADLTRLVSDEKICLLYKLWDMFRHHKGTPGLMVRKESTTVVLVGADGRQLEVITKDAAELLSLQNHIDANKVAITDKEKEASKFELDVSLDPKYIEVNMRRALEAFNDAVQQVNYDLWTMLIQGKAEMTWRDGEPLVFIYQEISEEISGIDELMGDIFGVLAKHGMELPENMHQLIGLDAINAAESAASDPLTNKPASGVATQPPMTDGQTANAVMAGMTRGGRESATITIRQVEGAGASDE
jgi:hypothetical protein